MAMSTQRQQQQQRDHRPPYANLLPQQRNVANPAFHFSPEAPNFNAAVKSPMANKPPQYPPSLVLQCAPEDSMVAGLTTTNIPQNSNAQPRPTATSTPGENDAPNAARNAGNGMTGGTDVFSGFNGVGNFNGSATNGVNDAGGGMIESNPFRPKASIKNSRHGKRLGFTVQDTLPQPPQFVQPSRVYSRKPGTPPILPPALGNTRQKLFQPQPAKSEFAKPGLRRDTKPKPYVLEPPAAAQLYPNLRCSDFFPWRGNHPGDHVTDAQAKNGQYDKLSVGKSNVPMSGVGSTELALTVYQNEQASARASIGPLFRKNNGLSTLSGLFSTVLEKRERYSRLTAMSSFKPPPRVTLPDQKRESWLRDLANPLVPLRKLSRTIPHGLKGSVLLDQCAAKNIPTPRAVWFARCVGANELRGLKRKGVGSFAVGSEAKWIREWTSQVQHFLDKQISGCGGPAEGWRSRMVYAVRLSAHLYADHLLDRNQFLEWYIGFLEKASLDTLPLAYLISRIFWSDLNKTRKLARRHAEALLAKVEVILATDDMDMYMPLLRRLSILLTDILLSHRDSMVMPKGWSQYSNVLQHCIDQSNSSPRECLENVRARNSNLMVQADFFRKTPEISAKKSLIKYLDTITVPVDLKKMSKQCLSIISNKWQVVQCLCEWAITPLRVGLHRLYIVVALLRMEHTSGSDIQEPLLAFLDSLRTNFVGNRDDFYLLVSELVRSKTFSIASYMKWLIARGAMSQFSSLDKDHPCHVRLLAEVPVYNAPSYIRNLRSILLRKTNFFTEHELETSKAMQGLLKDLFEQRSETGERGGVLTFEETQQLRSLSRAVMAELALWIRDHYVRVHVVKGQPVGRDNWRDLSVDVGTTTISTRQFCLIRGVLEDFRDYVVLADVVKMVASSSVSTTLAAVADTISYNIEIFSALGVAGSLLQLLHARYKKLRTRRTIEKFLVVSLVELASLPELDEAIRDELQNDLATYDKRYPRASMANSPISDSMGADSSEEIDQLAMNGAGIDRQHLSRLFETTASKMETSFEETGAQRQLSSLASHLVKLRQLDASSFDDLMKGWITRLFHLSSRPSLSQTLATLMTALCLDFELLVKVTLGAIKANPMKLSNVAATEIAAQTLELLVGDGSFEGSFSPEELYGLKRKRKQFQLRHTSIFVQLVTRSIQVCVSTGSEELSRRIERLATSQFSLRLLRSAASMQPDLLNSDLVEPLSKPRNMALSRWLGIIIDNLLDDHDSSDLADTDPEVQVTHLLHLANDFSIGLCQLKIRIIFDRQKKSPSITVGESTLVGSNPVTKAFFRGIANSFEDRINIWCDLVTVLSPECACQIRMYAEELFLQSPTFPRVQLPTDPMEPRISDYQGNGETLAKALLSLIDATAGSIPLAGIPSYSSLLVNRLHALVHSMTNPDEDGDKEDGGMEIGWSESFSELRCWLLLLLRIVILHRNAFFSNGKSGDSARMVVGLYALLQLEQIQNDPELFDFVFDVACSFVDELTEDSRQQIRRFTKGRTQPPRMTYLTGGMEQTEDWLRATQRGKLIEYPMKPWERLAEPTPIIGENDTSLSLVLFRTRKVRCARSH